jgi:RNA polymerase sigma factor (TIGR02999 family)
MSRSKPPASEPDPPASDGRERSLEEWDTTDEASRAQLVEAIYPQLKRIAEQHMRLERQDHTLQPTALVNEFFLILARQRRFTVNGRAHFLAIASRAMRRLLIDYARSRGAKRHGGSMTNVQLDPTDLPVSDGTFSMLEVDELLDLLAVEEPRMAKVVELKCFGGLTFSEIGQVLLVDERTAKRDWQVARAWLFGRLNIRRSGLSDRGTPDDS